MWRHRWQPTRLRRPWDSPGKNTGVGCHFLLQCMKVKSESEVAQSCPTLSDPMDFSPPGSSVHGIFQARVLEWGAIAFSRSNLAHTQISLYTDETCDFSILESRVSYAAWRGFLDFVFLAARCPFLVLTHRRLVSTWVEHFSQQGSSLQSLGRAIKSNPFKVVSGELTCL